LSGISGAPSESVKALVMVYDGSRNSTIAVALVSRWIRGPGLTPWFGGSRWCCAATFHQGEKLALELPMQSTPVPMDGAWEGETPVAMRCGVVV